MSAVQLLCACPPAAATSYTDPLQGAAHCSAKQMLKPATKCLPSQPLDVQLRCSAQPWAWAPHIYSACTLGVLHSCLACSAVQLQGQGDVSQACHE